MTSPIAVAVSGNDKYSVTGTGTLAFYESGEGSLGASGNWNTYSAALSGIVSITLTVPVGALTLNGQTACLPGLTRSRRVRPRSREAATARSPNFAGSASITATNDTINLGPGSGTSPSAASRLIPPDETTLDGYSGTINVSAGGTGSTDSVALNGNAGNALQVTVSSSTLYAPTRTRRSPSRRAFRPASPTRTTSRPTPRGLDGHDRQQAATSPRPPHPDSRAGLIPIQIIAQSQTDSSLVAQTTVDVDDQADPAGNQLRRRCRLAFHRALDGAQLPTAFRATIQNLGPAADTYNLSFSNVPGGFTIASSGTSLTVPAGQTGIVGIYLIPNSGQPLPCSWNEALVHRHRHQQDHATITKTQDVTFTVPAIDAVTISGSPTSVNTTPGVGATDTLTITNVGNVPENNIMLAATTSSGLTISGLAPLSLAVGQSATETVTLTPATATPLNSMLQATITATYGPSSAAQTQTLNMVVDVVVPGAAAIANAAVAAQQLNNSGLAGRLQDLSTALTNLVQNPTSPVYKGQALANLTSLISQITNDPFLSGFTAGLTARKHGAQLRRAPRHRLRQPSPTLALRWTRCAT